MTGSRDIFTKISRSSERDKVFLDLTTSRCEFIGKSPEPLSETFLFRALFYNGNELECEILVPTKQLARVGEMTLQILVGDEKYLCSTRFHVRDTKVYFNTKVDLFQLQRRNDFRLRLPISYRAFFQIHKLNGVSHLTKLQLIDLSGGGCRATAPVDTSEIVTGAQVRGEISLPDRPAIPVEGLIRHSKADENEKFRTIGVQFTNLSDLEKNKLVGVVMDLYRTLFSRLSQK